MGLLLGLDSCISMDASSLHRCILNWLVLVGRGKKKKYPQKLCSSIWTTSSSAKVTEWVNRQSLTLFSADCCIARRLSNRNSGDLRLGAALGSRFCVVSPRRKVGSSRMDRGRSNFRYIVFHHLLFFFLLILKSLYTWVSAT